MRAGVFARQCHQGISDRGLASKSPSQRCLRGGGRLSLLEEGLFPTPPSLKLEPQSELGTIHIRGATGDDVSTPPGRWLQDLARPEHRETSRSPPSQAGSWQTLRAPAALGELHACPIGSLGVMSHTWLLSLWAERMCESSCGNQEDVMCGREAEKFGT